MQKSSRSVTLLSLLGHILQLHQVLIMTGIFPWLALTGLGPWCQRIVSHHVLPLASQILLNRFGSILFHYCQKNLSSHTLPLMPQELIFVGFFKHCGSSNGVLKENSTGGLHLAPILRVLWWYKDGKQQGEAGELGEAQQSAQVLELDRLGFVFRLYLFLGEFTAGKRKQPEPVMQKEGDWCGLGYPCEERGGTSTSWDEETWTDRRKHVRYSGLERAS